MRTKMKQNENIIFEAFINEKLGVQECSKCFLTHETLDWKKYITPYNYTRHKNFRLGHVSTHK